MFSIMRKYTLQAAHHLPNVPDWHKCRRVHGHTWEIEIWVQGEVCEPNGWFVDFAALDLSWNVTVHARLDHTDLNDTIPNPTTENLCTWIADHLLVAGLHRIVARENAHSAVELQLSTPPQHPPA